MSERWLNQPPADSATAPPPQAADQEVPWRGLDVLLAVVAGVVLGLCVIVGLGFVLRDAEVSQGVKFLLFGLPIYGWVTFMIWWLVVRRHNLTLHRLGLRRVSPGVIFLMIPLTLAVLFVTNIVTLLSRLVFDDVPNAQDQLGVAPSTLTPLDLVCLLIAVAIVAPIVEEVVFRGLLYPLVRQRRGVVIAVVVSALVFAVTHLFPLLWPSLFVFGAILAVVFERSGSLYPAIVLHALNNGLAVGLVFATQ